MPNIENLRRVLNVIEHTPKEGPFLDNRYWLRVSTAIRDATFFESPGKAKTWLYQESTIIPETFQGVSLCFAGFAGFVFGLPRPRNIDVLDGFGMWIADGDSVSYFAQKKFELSDDQANTLFFEENTFEQIVAMVDYLEEFPDASGQLLAEIAKD